MIQYSVAGLALIFAVVIVVRNKPIKHETHPYIAALVFLGFALTIGDSGRSKQAANDAQNKLNELAPHLEQLEGAAYNLQKRNRQAYTTLEYAVRETSKMPGSKKATSAMVEVLNQLGAPETAELPVPWKKRSDGL